METEDQAALDRKRKSLAIDLETYERLRDICARERRTIISQLQLMIEQKHDDLFDRDNH
jgi:L-lactate utilization protein LutB